MRLGGTKAVIAASNGALFEAWERVGITAYVPPNRGTNNQGDGQLFDRGAFTFEAEVDRYRCPAGLLRRANEKRPDTIGAFFL